MKKFLCIFFSAFFVLTSLAVGACADDVTVNFDNQKDHITCDYCSATFKTAEEYKNHYDTLIPVSGHSVECAFCTKSFTAKRAYFDHVYLCSNANPEVLTKHSMDCEYEDNGCDDSFSDNGEIMTTDGETVKVTYDEEEGKFFAEYNGASYKLPDYSFSFDVNGETKTISSKAKIAYEEHVDSCPYEKVWTLIKAGKIIDAIKLVDWSDVWSTVKPVLEKIVSVVKGIDLSGVVDTVKNLFSKIPFDSIISWVKGLFNK